MSKGEAKDKQDVQTWLSYGLPFRPASGTYAFCDAASLPALDEEAMKPFSHLATLDDVAQCAKSLERTHSFTHGVRRFGGPRERTNLQ